MDLSKLNPDELTALKSTIDVELCSRSEQMMEKFDDLLKDVREMRSLLGISKATVLKRLFPVIEGSGRGRHKKVETEGQVS